jgi:hypothetical protein
MRKVEVVRPPPQLGFSAFLLSRSDPTLQLLEGTAFFQIRAHSSTSYKYLVLRPGSLMSWGCGRLWIIS